MTDSARTAGATSDGAPNRSPSYEAILSTAEALFLERGFPNVSMDLIARRAAVVRATVYNNFADKEAILIAILDRYQRGYAAIPDRLSDLATEDRSSFELIEATIRAAFEWRLANRQLRPLIDLAKSLPANAAWNAAGAAADDVVTRWLLRIHRRDARLGIVRHGLRLGPATAAVWGMVDAALARSDSLPSPAAVRTTTRELALLHWYAIYSIEPGLPGPGLAARRTARPTAGIVRGTV